MEEEGEPQEETEEQPEDLQLLARPPAGRRMPATASAGTAASAERSRAAAA